MKLPCSFPNWRVVWKEGIIYEKSENNKNLTFGAVFLVLPGHACGRDQQSDPEAKPGQAEAELQIISSAGCMIFAFPDSFFPFGGNIRVRVPVLGTSDLNVN